MRYIWSFQHTFTTRSCILNPCRSRRSAPHRNENIIIHLRSFDSLSSSYATPTSASELSIFLKCFSDLPLKSQIKHIGLTSISYMMEKTYSNVSSYRSEEGQRGSTSQTHDMKRKGLRLGVDEPSRVVRMMAISSGEEALNMMPVDSGSPTGVPSGGGMIPSAAGTRVGCQRGRWA